MARSRKHIRSFEFEAGDVLSGRYEVLGRLGGGWEGEVYRVRERSTGIDRAAKLFFPHRNPHDRVAKAFAKKLHRLRHCPIVIQYHGQDTVRFRGEDVTALISDYVEGRLLSEFIATRRGKRLTPFAAVHLLHALAEGVAAIHRAGEYHGDLHSENIIVQRYGLGFELKVLDVFHWEAPKKESIRDDVVEMVRTFHEALGGPRWYSRQPPEVKAICCGLKRSLILRKFRTAGQLRTYLETMDWT